MLEHSQIAAYLLEHGLTEPRDVVDGELRIEDVSSRNRVFLAGRRDGSAIVVKQARQADAAALAHEAAVLRALAQVPALTAHVPHVAAFDADAGVLTLTTPGDGLALTAAERRRCVPLLPLRVLGGVLAALHALPPDAIEPRDEDTDPAWGLLLDALPYSMLIELSAAGRDLLRRIQHGPELVGRLTALSPAADAVVHGDVRWSNCLAATSGETRRRTGLVLIDWELAGAGSAAFDVGSVLAELLRMWVVSIPLVAPHEPWRIPARVPLARLRPAAAAFFSAYRARRPLAPGVAAELAAVRLLQSAFELADGFSEVPATAVLLVQVAANILAGPERAAAELLGLRE
jgi:Ser/Thr protein kinase RdoA (MazF antagonist)